MGERYVHKKGWAEGSTGSGQKRAVTDDDFEHMCRELKGSGFEYTVTKEDEKLMAKTGGKPTKELMEKLKLAQGVIFFLREYT